MIRSKIYAVLTGLLVGGAVLMCFGSAWRVIDNPTLEQLKSEAVAPFLLVWALSAAWVLRRCASGGVLPRAEPPRPCLTAWRVVLAFLICFLLPAVMTSIVYRPGEDPGAMARSLAVNSAARLLALYIVLAMVRGCGRNPAEALGIGLRSSDGRVAAGVITFVAGLPAFFLVSSLWTNLVERLLGERTDLRQEIVKLFGETSSVPLRVQIAVAAVLVAPVIEELLFRGLLYGLLRRHARPVLAMIAVGMLFGAIHDSPVAFVPLSLFGVLMCYLYEKTGRLSVPIVAHMIFNGIMVMLMEVYRGAQ